MRDPDDPANHSPGHDLAGWMIVLAAIVALILILGAFLRTFGLTADTADDGEPAQGALHRFGLNS
jgi:hypothetical protein